MGFGSAHPRGSGRVRGRAEALNRALGNTGQRGGSAPSFDECPGIIAAILCVVDSGAAITFSRTRDGGASVVAVIDNGDISKHYARDSAELGSVIQAICEVYSQPEKPA